MIIIFNYIQWKRLWKTNILVIKGKNQQWDSALMHRSVNTPRHTHWPVQHSPMPWSFFWGTFKQRLGVFCPAPHPVWTLLCISESFPDLCNWGFTSVNTPFESASGVQQPTSHQSISLLCCTHWVGIFSQNLQSGGKTCIRQKNNQAQYSFWNQIFLYLSHFINSNEKMFRLF